MKYEKYSTKVTNDVNSSQSMSPINKISKKRLLNVTHNETLTNSSVNQRSRSTLPHEDPVIKLQTKISLIDKLLGNTREGRDLKDRFFQMILTPQESYQSKKRWQARPYIRQLMKPGQNYEDQAKRSPRLTEKEVYVESVLNERQGSITKIETKSLLNSVSQLGINSSPSQIMPKVDCMNHDYLMRIASHYEAAVAI